MLHIVLLISLVLFFTYGSIVGVKQTKQLLKMKIDEKTRINYYKAIFSMWLPVIVLFLVIAFTDITFEDIGFSLLAFNMNKTITIIVLVLAGLWSAYWVCHIVAFLTSAKFRQYRNKVIKTKTTSDNYYDSVIYNLMIPKTKNEKKWWVAVSLTAGVCEEVIFRGVYFFLIASIFPNISVSLVFVIGVGLFGLGHLYQGWKGFTLATLVGAFLALIYIVSGSLILVILIHFLTDLASAFEYSDE